MHKLEDLNSLNHLEVNKIIDNRLSNPGIVKARNGDLVFGTDEGFNYKEKNEDAIVVNTDKDAFAVIDGMGGYDKGSIASQILAEEIQQAFEEEGSVKEAQRNASDRMKQQNIIDGGACYISGKIEDNILKVNQAGDVRLIVFNKNGRIKVETQDEGLGHIVSNAVQGKKAGETKKYSIKLDTGDRILCASDHLWDNLSTVEVEELVAGKTATEAMKVLNERTKELMESGSKEAKPDNRSLLIYDFNKNLSEIKSNKKIENINEIKRPEKDIPYSNNFVNRIKSWFATLPDYFKDKDHHVSLDSWSIGPDVALQNKLVTALAKDNYDIFYKDDVEISEDEQKIVLTDIMEGKISNNDIKKVLVNINASSVFESDPKKPEKLFSSLYRFVGSDYHMPKIVSHLMGKKGRDFTVQDLGVFLEKYPDPSGLESRMRKIIAQHSKGADDEKRAYEEWRSFVNVTVSMLYGDRYDYYQQFKYLQEKGNVDEKLKDLNSFESEEISDFQESDKLLQIKKAANYFEIEKIMLDEMVDFLQKIKQDSGFENLTIHGKKLGDSYSPSDIAKSLEYNREIENNEVLEYGLKQIKKRGPVYLRDSVAVHVTKPALLKVMGEEDFKKRWNNEWPLGTKVGE